MPTSKYFSKLANTRILVLGGTSGIGFAVAEAAIEHGAIVTVASSTQAKLDKAIERLQSSYPEHKDNITSVQCDIGNPVTIEESIVTALKHAAGDGKVDHVVVTATGNTSRPQLVDFTPENVVGLNIKNLTVILIAKHAHEYIHSSPSSSITWTSGTLIDKPTPGATLLAGLGSALNGLGKALAIELKPIRCNVVSPGLIDTEMVRGFPGAEAMVEGFRKGSLTGTVGRPEDTAEAYLYLMKDRFVTGQVISTDGGRLLA